ncbi:MAG: acetate--CoA ligase [Chromatiaceae bacterium]|nr:acetate--CoA ligase [Chromatiaceae bacterium]
MDWKVISKEASAREVSPNLAGYASAVKAFSWGTASRELDGLPSGGLNIAHEAIDRHIGGPLRDHLALRFLTQEGAAHNFTYAQLHELTNRFANLLRRLGVAGGDRVATLLGPVPELFIAALGALKNRSVFCPLYAAFGPEPVRVRLNLSGARVLVTTEALYRRKIRPQLDALPSLEYVLISQSSQDTLSGPVCRDLSRLIDEADRNFQIGPTAPEDWALLHFTSGTTGTPKGVVHVHNAVLMHQVSGKLALDIHRGDVFWCTADPGWVTGTSYGIIAPLTLGATLVIDEAPFDPERWYRDIEEQKVNVWYTSPTAIRMMMRLGAELPRRFDTSSLRFLASVGEPLNPEAVVWGQEAFGLPFHDNWWQTETGGILIANFRAMDIRPGSMGRPLPGIAAAVVERREDGSVRWIDDPDEPGELAIRKGWPSMFRTYLGEQERYEQCFAGDWYLTGDLARRDRDGYFWFVGRKDDLIKSSGHLIGPFEVENVLMTHPAVAEAGVIGKPDPTAMEIVKAFVSLKPGQTPDEALRRDILAYARRLLGAVVAPKELEFRETLPRTRSGKIMRRLLKAGETGAPPGDLSTLESGASD